MMELKMRRVAVLNNCSLGNKQKYILNQNQTEYTCDTVYNLPTNYMKRGDMSKMHSLMLAIAQETTSVDSITYAYVSHFRCETHAERYSRRYLCSFSRVSAYATKADYSPSPYRCLFP
jgi:hypothetical protein